MSDTVLPPGWSLPRLGELMSFKNGLNKGKDFFGHGTPIVNYMDVFNNTGMNRSDIVGLVDVSKAEKKAYSARRGDVFFTRTSETPDEVGISSVLTEDIDDAVFSGFVLRGRPQVDRISSGFAEYCFTSRFVRAQIVASATYTTRALTNGRTLSAVRLPLPDNPAEQQAIAEALSDADGVVEGLERLIEKKRRIKQGAMQDLLTAKRRLPGFSGEWTHVRLGSIMKITTGRKDVNEGNELGSFPFFTCAREYTYSDSYSFDCDAILVAGNGEVGNLNRYSGKFEAYQRTYVLHGSVLKLGYVWHQMSFALAASLGIGKIGSSIPYIKKNDLLDFDVAVPHDEAEIDRIVSVLDDMDTEITALETRLQKARAIKEGMMQNLLTGRIRLV